MIELRNHVGGKAEPPLSGAYLDVLEPATGKPHARVPDSGGADIDRAVKAAADAFPAWSATSATERSRLMIRLADLIDAHTARLADAESRDTGKPVSVASQVDIPRSSASIRHFATAILHSASEVHEFDGGGLPGGVGGGVRALNFTLRRPRGVAGLITPWNLPLYLLTWKLAPAIATGNTAVCKPSEVTPMTAAILGELCVEAGIPPGVVNMVHGRGGTAGAALVRHPSVPTISFTGSTAVGRWIAKEGGERLKRVSLELGGKNPFIVCADADLEAAAQTGVRAGFSNQGQICLCGSRLIVHESIADRFLERYIAIARELKAGDPSDPATRFGAITSPEQLAKIESYVRAARELGGRVLLGGSRVSPSNLPARCKDGLFHEPTVIDGLPPTCSVETEEIFGPVVTVQRFTDDQHALTLANSTDYGLSATVFTQDLNRAHRLSGGLDSGVVWVNCWMVRDLRTPFGGTKQSGVGREGGAEAMKFFTEPKNVCMRI